MSLFFAGSASTTTIPSMSIAYILSRLAIGFTKDAGNPVLPKGTSGEWDDWGVRDMAVLVDGNGLKIEQPDGLWGYYWGRPDASGPIKIGLAKSTDNGETWIRFGSNPIISGSGAGGSWYEDGIATGAVILEGGGNLATPGGDRLTTPSSDHLIVSGTYYMVATGIAGGFGTTVGVLMSADGTSWNDQGVRLTVADFMDGATAITEGGVAGVIKRFAGDYLAVFEYKSSVTNAWRVFAATAPSLTGTWTPLNGGQPIFSPTGTGWESVGVANPRIIENSPGSYLLAYNGISTTTGWQIGFAYSTTLTTWTRYSGNPVLTKGAGGQWDDLQVETTYLFKEPSAGVLRLLYQGYSAVDGSMQVGLATA